MNVFDNFTELFSYMNGRALLVWLAIIFIILLKSIKSIIINPEGINTKVFCITKYKDFIEGYGQKFKKLVKKLYKRKKIKHILIVASISMISFGLFLMVEALAYSHRNNALFSFGSFLLLVSVVSICISVFLLFKEISLYLFSIAISGNSAYKTAKTIVLIKLIYYILMSYWGGVLFIFGAEEVEKPSYHNWSYMLGSGVNGFLYISYFLLLFATILLLFTLLSIAFSYDLKAEKISERLKFIAFNYLQIVFLLTGLVTCSAILFGDFEGVLTEITIKGFLNCFYTVFLSIQDISIVYNQAVSVFGKIVLTICSSCNLLFIGMFVGIFLERN